MKNKIKVYEGSINLYDLEGDADEVIQRFTDEINSHRSSPDTKLTLEVSTQVGYYDTPDSHSLDISSIRLETDKEYNLRIVQERQLTQVQKKWDLKQLAELKKKYEQDDS